MVVMLVTALVGVSDRAGGCAGGWVDGCAGSGAGGCAGGVRAHERTRWVVDGLARRAGALRGLAWRHRHTRVPQATVVVQAMVVLEATEITDHSRHNRNTTRARATDPLQSPNTELLPEVLFFQLEAAGRLT